MNSPKVWVVYKQFPGIHGELQGRFWGVLELMFGQFYRYVPSELSMNNNYNPLLKETC